MDQQKPKTQTKMMTMRKFEETCRMICQSGYRSSGTVRWMKVFQNIETLLILLMKYLQSREEKWFPKDRNCDICLRIQIERASYRRRTGTVVPRAENSGDSITADHKSSLQRM